MLLVCGSDLQRGHSGDGCLSSSILFKYERSRGHLLVRSWADRLLWGVLFRSDVSDMVFVTLLCCRLSRYVLTMVV